jgi:hypothetical protein
MDTVANVQHVDRQDADVKHECVIRPRFTEYEHSDIGHEAEIEDAEIKKRK